MELFWKTEHGSDAEKSAVEIILEMKRLHHTIKKGTHGGDAIVGKLKKKSNEALSGTELVMVEVYLERAVSLLTHIRDEDDHQNIDLPN